MWETQRVLSVREWDGSNGWMSVQVISSRSSIYYGRRTGDDGHGLAQSVHVRGSSDRALVAYNRFERGARRMTRLMTCLASRRRRSACQSVLAITFVAVVGAHGAGGS